MAPPPNPSTSYSDPIYDRLEVAAHGIGKRIWLIIIAIIAIVVIAVISHNLIKNNPTAASANRFLNAHTLSQEAEFARAAERIAMIDEAAKALTAVATDEAVTPYYRARAYIELTQIAIDRSQLSDAANYVSKAKELAVASADPDLDLAVDLSQAAVAMQQKEFAKAETLYAGVDRAAGTKFPDRQLAGAIGVAKALQMQGENERALEKLETVISLTDSNASSLINLAKNEYWALKRRLATPEPKPDATTPEAKPDAPAPAPGTDANAAPTPAPTAPVTPAEQPAVTESATPAPTTESATPAPVAPATPEGGK